jgi:hypothetical protein
MYGKLIANNALKPFAGLMMLDIDVRLTCSDLKFAFEVWGSARNAIVGYYPRIHR